MPTAILTDEQLRELFARHCECRPLDLRRTDADHAAIHDCDTGILRDVQVVLGIVPINDIGRVQEINAASDRCTVMFHAKRNAQGGWDV